MDEIEIKEEKNCDEKQTKQTKEDILREIKQFILKYREWMISIVGVAGLILSKTIVFSYKNECEEYYGVSIQYFDGQQRLERAEIFGIFTALLIIYPIVIYILGRFFEQKKDKIMICIALSGIFVYQSLTYDEFIMLYSDFVLLRKIAASWITIGVLLIADVSVSFFPVYKDKNKILNTVAIISLVIIIINVILGISAGLNINIENKRKYEILDGGKSAVISTYDGKFVVMDCEIDNNNHCLYLDNTSYRLEEMVGHDIQYIKFESVELYR